jgi:type IV secretion system protein VirD4
MNRFMLGRGDPFTAAQDAFHYAKGAQHQQKQGRPLRTPDEILTLHPDEQILMLSGMENGRMLVNRYPYFSRRELAGAYLQNPYFPPADKVQVQCRLGKRTRKIIAADPPRQFRDFPQFQKGYRYVEGYG